MLKTVVFLQNQVCTLRLSVLRVWTRRAVCLTCIYVSFHLIRTLLWTFNTKFLGQRFIQAFKTNFTTYSIYCYCVFIFSCNQYRENIYIMSVPVCTWEVLGTI